MAVPKYDELFNPLLKALHKLGGSGTVEEIEEKTAGILNLTEKQLAEIHRGSTTKFSYRLAWTRNYLKRYGLLENSARGVWSLTPKGFATKFVDKEKIKRQVKKADIKTRKRTKAQVEGISDSEEWKTVLLEHLVKMNPFVFERFCQLFLREAGFFEVEVTPKSGDGGIDGWGKIRIGGLLSFQIAFQCKRYKGSVGASAIRDFRGSIHSPIDKGLFITTGSFTREAKNEATGEGKMFIDLIDGGLLAEKMKELGLGVKVEAKEKIEVDSDWFEKYKA